MNYTKKKAKCKVWEKDNPDVYWFETFLVYDLSDIDTIFETFNTHLRPNELARCYKFLEFTD